jgi:hypothetical protein
MTHSASDDTPVVYQMRISLLDVEPEVWRQVLVPGSATLATLHSVIQLTMGWSNKHLHNFEISGNTYEMRDDENDDDELIETDYTVEMVVREGDRFVYEYDFGDGWTHHIQIEAVLPTNPELTIPTVLAGANMCPHEDSGGPRVYKRILKETSTFGDGISDERNPHFREFAPRAFDVVEINARLQRMV